MLALRIAVILVGIAVYIWLGFEVWRAFMQKKKPARDI